MAVESKRGCGYRKVGGIYLVSDKLTQPCDRLPFQLEVCPCCGAGIKPARAWTWIDPIKLFGGHPGCQDTIPFCPICQPNSVFGASTKFIDDREIQIPQQRAGLLWVGDKFYSVNEFIQEAQEQGISRRIPALPRDFIVGMTWVFLGHKEACPVWTTFDGIKLLPGIFTAFKPKRIELIVNRSEYEIYNHAISDILDAKEEAEVIAALDEEKLEVYTRLSRYVARGMSLVPVPDDDPDHH